MGIPPSQPTGPLESDESIAAESASHGEFVAALARAYTLTELFPLQHATLQGALSLVIRRSSSADPATLQVRKAAVEIEGHPVPDPHGHLREFARDLSRAGVTELRIPGQLGPEEFETFIAALRTSVETTQLGLDELLAEAGGSPVELAFHGGPRAAVLAADPPVTDDAEPVAHESEAAIPESGPAATEVEVALAETELAEIERTEADASGTDTDGVAGQDLVLEPLGASLMYEPPLAAGPGEVAKTEHEEVAAEPSAHDAGPQLALVRDDERAERHSAQDDESAPEALDGEASDPDEEGSWTEPEAWSAEEQASLAEPEAWTADSESTWAAAEEHAAQNAPQPGWHQADWPAQEWDVPQSFDDLAELWDDDAAEADEIFAASQAFAQPISQEPPNPEPAGDFEVAEADGTPEPLLAERPADLPVPAEHRAELETELVDESWLEPEGQDFLDDSVFGLADRWADVVDTAQASDTDLVDEIVASEMVEAASVAEAAGEVLETDTFAELPADTDPIPTTDVAPIPESDAEPAFESETQRTEVVAAYEATDSTDTFAGHQATDSTDTFAAEVAALDAQLRAEEEAASAAMADAFYQQAEDLFDGELDPFYDQSAAGPDQADDAGYDVPPSEPAMDELELLEALEEPVGPTASAEEPGPSVADRDFEAAVTSFREALGDEIESANRTSVEAAPEPDLVLEPEPALALEPAPVESAPELAPDPAADFESAPSSPPAPAVMTGLPDVPVIERSANRPILPAAVQPTEAPQIAAHPEPVGDSHGDALAASLTPDATDEVVAEDVRVPELMPELPAAEQVVAHETAPAMEPQPAEPMVTTVVVAREAAPDPVASDAQDNASPSLWEPEGTEIDPEGDEAGGVQHMAPVPEQAVEPRASLRTLADRFATQPDQRGDLRDQILREAQDLSEAEGLSDVAEAVVALIVAARPGDDEPRSLARELCQPPVVDALLEAMGELRDSGEREEWSYAFGRLGAVMAPALANALSSVPPRAARRNFMDTLFMMGEDAVQVAMPMLDDSRWFIVRNGVDILGEAGSEKIVARLALALAHPDHRVRRATVMALSKLGGSDAGALLLPVLDDPAADVREAAAMGVGHLQVQKALRPLVKMLEAEKDDDVVMILLRSLGQIGDPGAVPAIEKRAVGRFFIKPATEVRVAAYRALAAIGTPHASKLVDNAREDRDETVAAVARQLAQG